jgi:hypothetical protein
VNIGIFLKIEVCEGGVIFYAGSSFIQVNMVITNGLYTSEHYIAVAADSGGTLKSAYEENNCYA